MPAHSMGEEADHRHICWVELAGGKDVRGYVIVTRDGAGAGAQKASFLGPFLISQDHFQQ